jgi:hypothetical protein
MTRVVGHPREVAVAAVTPPRDDLTDSQVPRAYDPDQARWIRS